MHLNGSLDRSDNAEAIHSNGKSRMFFLRRLRSFGVCNRMLQMFYQSVMASVLFFGITCWAWGGNNRARHLVGSSQGVEDVARERMAPWPAENGTLDSILDNPSHKRSHVIGVSEGMTDSSRISIRDCASLLYHWLSGCTMRHTTVVRQGCGG